MAAKRSEAARDQAQRATLMARVGERLARGQGGPAALLLADMKNPEEARGWDQLAIDVPRLARSCGSWPPTRDVERNSLEWLDPRFSLVTVHAKREPAARF